MLTEVRLYCVWQASTQLDYHGYFSPRVGQKVPINQKIVSYMKYHIKWLFSNIMIHSNIIIQKLDILAVFNAINDGQLYILRGHKLYFRKNAFFH